MSEQATGIVKMRGREAVLVNLAAPTQGPVALPIRLVQQHKLASGARVSGPLGAGSRSRELAAIDTICGRPAAVYLKRPRFADLTAIDPQQRFALGMSGDRAMRAVELVAPVGKGTRGLIVAPPKAGKTMLIAQIARSIRQCEPDVRVVAMLIAERPEEVTEFRRSTDAEVFASSSDQSPAEHAALSELMLAHIRSELECGNDVVVLLDSLTRLTRAYNLGGSSGVRRTLSGGVDAAALELPRRFLGLARNIENGGSVTILATVLVDTNSRMDQLLYEEFKSTSNSEIVLSRDLAQAQIFPALDIARSGTRKEERLYSAAEMPGLVALRRMLAGLPARDAHARLMQLIDRYPTNAELLAALGADTPRPTPSRGRRSA